MCASINAAIERDDGRSEKGDVRENMHMTNSLATSSKRDGGREIHRFDRRS